MVAADPAPAGNNPTNPYAFPPADKSRPNWSLEFFPPLTEAGTLNLHDRIERMCALGPAAVSVTWGAGGSTSDRSLALLEFVASLKEHGAGENEGVLHLTCTNMNRSKVVEALDRAKALGVKNILALRGDPPRDAEYAVNETSSETSSLSEPPFVYAIDLVRFIRKHYPGVFAIGVAGYPDTHPDSPTPEADVDFLKAKVDAGADFIVTQLFYDVDIFLNWQARCRKAGINVPIVPGVMPIQNYSSFRRMTNLCRATVPQKIIDDLEPIKNDDTLVKSYGVDLAISMVQRLISEGKVEGVHFCTLNLEKSVVRVLQGLGWLPAPTAPLHPNLVQQTGHNQLIFDPSASASLSKTIPSFLISSADASLTASAHHSHVHTHNSPSLATAQLPTAGKTEGDSWDEYPNGRFTDTRSPAYGELDGYGSGVKILPQEALKEWGTPTSTQDISALFTSYLLKETPWIPWCPTPLESESEAILPLLLKVNAPERGWWTVGSQPAVDGAKSEDKVYGFGPRGGFVFQKAFVEFFVTEKVVLDIEERAMATGGVFTFYAGNKKGDFRTNMTPQDVNAVTWAVFPGKEIVQSTIIEEVSFLSWKEEAFDIWQDWSYLYPADSPSRKLLQNIADTYWLVSLVHHDYKDPEGLERFLLRSTDEVC